MVAKMPKISVILTSFNHEKFIREAIDSVLNQTFTDFELIIWDDASSDGSWEVTNSYSDSRIKAFRNEVTMRGIYGINKSISEIATGEYIAIHHSDDVWELDKLEKQFAFLGAHPEIGAAFTNALAIAEDGSFLADEKHYYSNIFDQPNRTRHEWLRFFFSHGNALCHPSVLIRKSCYEDCGLYRYGFAQVGDFDMWIRLCLKHEIHVLPEKLIKFRIRDNEANASGSRPETRIRVFTEFYKLLNSYKNLDSFEDLVKVFPNAEKYYRDEGSDKDFALAMIALEEKPYSFTQLFGLDILFEVISSSKRSARIKRLYGFDYMSLIALTAQHDIFFWKEHDVTILHEAANNLNHVLAEHDQEIVAMHEAANNLNHTLAERDQEIVAMREAANNLNHTLAERDQEIVAMHDSLSWRITKPLRLLRFLFSGRYNENESLNK
jgi:glycosyltransferase involved in cell wall biosynthesis